MYGLSRFWLIDDDTDEVIFLYIKLSLNVVRTTKVSHAQDLDIIISLKSHNQKDVHKAINETAVLSSAFTTDVNYNIGAERAPCIH